MIKIKLNYPQIKYKINITVKRKYKNLLNKG